MWSSSSNEFIREQATYGKNIFIVFQIVIKVK